MTVLNIATTQIRDEEKIKGYSEAVAPLMKKFGAEVVVRGKYLTTLLGESQTAHIVGFSDLKTWSVPRDFTRAQNILKGYP